MMETVSAVLKYFRRSNSTLMAWTWGTPRVSGRFAPGAVLQISSDGDDRMGTKIKTKINPWAKLTPPPNNPGPNFRALKTAAKFSYPKISQNQKFQTQKIPWQEPMHLWNPSLPKITCLISSFTVLWSVLCHWANCLGGGGDSQMKEAGGPLSWGWEAMYIPSLNFNTCHIGEGSKIP